ncbi:MAG: biopolymer transporter ExbD [Nitrospirae bacterium]|jgi:biopolymer transport protein ExbD|uniref:Biopolymer transport protein ExbD/TolR n=1 Tax=Leptospirillum ferrodiazotrophum TaxID=412449 RepID=C6HXR5_9BACT|nr:MAG: Biopolymer transport protein ExbD/TolR [Leptospirillum ferrodiazotrophum]MCL5953611.1 biopolymer transporter ExbD [Nitrospirota bacterium]
MRLFRDGGDDSPKARIELIPMIDIMFFLMVVFIFISMSLVKLNGVTVALPKAADHPLKQVPKMVNITITEEGKILIENIPVNRSELKEHLHALLADKSAKYEVIVSGDKDSKLQRLVDVMDLCNQMGFSNVSIRSEDLH